jgi:hypothetical protein
MSEDTYTTCDQTVQFYTPDHSDQENRSRVKNYLDNLVIFYAEMDRNDSSRNRIVTEMNRVSKWLTGK